MASNLVRYGLAIVTLAGTAPAFGQGSTELMVTATIRDFPDSHPDFCKPMTVGARWVEASVAPQLGVLGRPVYTGQGQRVTIPATDAAGHVIASALIKASQLMPVDGVRLVSAPAITGTSSIDTYDPSIGPYGGTNVATGVTAMTGQTMPTITEPILTSYTPNAVYSGDLTGTLAGSFRCSTFRVENGYKLTIVGDVTIVVDNEFRIRNRGTICLAAGAKLTVYAKGICELDNAATINLDAMDPGQFTLYRLGPGDLVIRNGSTICGTIVCPQGRVAMPNTATVYGRVTAARLFMDNASAIHVPHVPQTPCGVAVHDKPAQFGAADTGAITSDKTFDQWFQDVPGVNEPAQARVRMTQDNTGAWAFSDSDFRPIDGELMSEGQFGANRNFTIALDGQFSFQPCTEQFFVFAGDGDAMAFVDGKLVLELIGNNAGVSQYVEFDRLGLDPNTKHTFHFYYAQRSCSPSNFSLRTNVTLDTTYTVEYAAVSCFD